MVSPHPPHDVDLGPLVSLLRERRAVVLAGAGCSTESGIPDYRGPEGRLRRRTPVQYGDFVRSAETRQRYWARSTVGWATMHGASPNPAHRAIADLERSGFACGLITQNVDGLHQAAGSEAVIELHGSLGAVVCLACGARSSREDLQVRLTTLNGRWLDGVGVARRAPDGDAELRDDRYDDFVVPDCEPCGGVLKPDVVFFGENVPKDRVGECWRLMDQAELLLVVGSSLTVYSGRRFVYGAVERGLPVGVVNIGPTRADDVAVAKVEARLGEVLPRVVEALVQGPM